ncbi:hypothetical protein N0V94_005631 [Neodidymelliopsis sp. IMI 364377]|nr:hypothetical protein N0V94_005631 [Neodidymelliopsis sp. IMI 364377]
MDDILTDQEKKLDLRYLGYYQGKYVLRQASKVLEKVCYLEKLIYLEADIKLPLSEEEATNDSSKENKGYQYRPNLKDVIMQKLHIEIYETIAHRIKKSDWCPLHCLPFLSDWMSKINGLNDWRNECAHQAGVPLPYERDEDNRPFNKYFDNNAFLSFLRNNLPLLHVDLGKLIYIIGKDIKNYAVLDNTLQLDQYAIDEIAIEEMLEDKNPEIVALKKESDALPKNRQACERLNRLVEREGLFDWKQATIIAHRVDERIRAIDKRSNEIHREMGARAAEIMEEEEKKSRQQWEGYDPNNDTKVGDWDSSDHVEPPQETPDHVEPAQEPQVSDSDESGRGVPPTPSTSL